MLLLLFLFLGGLGTRAEEQVVCRVKRGESFTCNITHCLGEVYTETTRDNVTCTCKNKHSQNYTLEFHGISTGDTCILTSLGETDSCAVDNWESCIEKFTNLDSSGMVAPKADCQCEKGYGTREQAKKAEGAQNQGKKAEGAQNQGKKAEGAQNQGKKAEGAQNQGKKSEGAQNQGKKSEGAQNQGKKSEGAQNQGKKSEGAQNQGKKSEGAQNQGKKGSEEYVPHESTVAQTADQLGEAPSTQNSTGVPRASNRNAEQGTQNEKKEEGVSAPARNSQGAAFLYLFLPFIAVMPRIN